MSNERRDWLQEEVNEKELELCEALNEIKQLKELLRDAANSVESWGSYASEYFQEKWDLQGDIKRYRDAGEC